MDRRAFGPEDEDESNIDKIKNNNNSKSKTPILDNFGKDLTELATKGVLDPVIGRDIEIDKLVQILNKRKKNNPVLVGESGVGKCFCSDTQVVMRNDLTGEIVKLSIKEFLKNPSQFQ